MVPPTCQYKQQEYINFNFITSKDIRVLLKKKFQGNALVKKTDADIDAIVTTRTNLINKIANLIVGLNVMLALPAYDEFLNNLVQTTNNS
jgi:hypothetical protein